MVDKLCRIRVENFKSLKSFDIKFNQFNVLIGPNGSGKTNVLELFKFANLCINPTRTPAYPFAFWGGYKNMVWSGDEDLPISLQISYVIEEHDVDYGISITGSNNERLTILEESLSIKDYLNITRDFDQLYYEFDENYARVSPTVENTSPVLKRILDESLNNFTLIYDDETSILKQPDWNTRYYPDYKFALLRTNAFVKDRVDPVILTSPLITINNKPAPLYKSAIDYLVNTNHIILLRQLNYSQLRGSTSINHSVDLHEDGDGLINLLYKWYNKFQRLPKIFELALKELFPNWQIYFLVTGEGNIIFNVDDNGINLAPSSIPDGFYKLLAILAAIELNPKILLIDELETSLHARIIEYVTSLLKNCNSTVIITTHSPVIVDSVDLEDLIMLEKDGYESVCKRIDNADELRHELHEKGVTASETWLYGEL